MLTEINSLLEKMPSITLEEMHNIHLMDRVDSKFVMPYSKLSCLLEQMAPYFKVQFHNEQRIASYTTQYLDTPDLNMFVMHQNGKLNRQKIRIRTYCDSDLSFLEVKNKNNKGRTKKTRVSIPSSHIKQIQDIGEKRDFLDDYSIFQTETLSPSLANSFKRITCVNNRLTERVTIDLDLKFVNYRSGEETLLSDVVILELKQDGLQPSDFRHILLNMRVKQRPFSKYCMGTVLTNPQVKYNRFKEKINLLTKLERI